MKNFEETRKKIKPIAQKYNLRLVILFGSAAVGKTHERSDIDIAIRGREKIGTDIFFDILYDFRKVFGGFQKDLCDIGRANPLLLHNIAETGNLLYGSEEDFAEFKIYAFKRYAEYQPYFKLEEKSNCEFIKNYAS